MEAPWPSPPPLHRVTHTGGAWCCGAPRGLRVLGWSPGWQSGRASVNRDRSVFDDPGQTNGPGPRRASDQWGLTGSPPMVMTEPRCLGGSALGPSRPALLRLAFARLSGSDEACGPCGTSVPPDSHPGLWAPSLLLSRGASLQPGGLCPQLPDVGMPHVSRRVQCVRECPRELASY